MDNLIDTIISTFKEDTNQAEFILKYDLKRILSSYINDVKQDSYEYGWDECLREHGWDD